MSGSIEWPGCVVAYPTPSQAIHPTTSANSNHAHQWWDLRSGCFLLTTGFIPHVLRCWQRVCQENGVLVISWSVFAASVALSTFPMWIIWHAYLTLAVESFAGRPPNNFWSSGLCSERVRLIVAKPWPVWWEICHTERPESSKLRMRSIWVEDSFCILSWGVRMKLQVIQSP